MSYKKGDKSNVYEAEDGYNLFASVYGKSWGFLNTFEEYELLRMLRDLKGKKVLDVGCGTGRTIGDLKKLGGEIVGCDISEEMLKMARKNFSGIEFVKADANNLPFEDQSFDVVVALFVIVHIRDLQKFFDEVYRVLKPGGFMIVSNINQRKAPKLHIKDGSEIVINSFYHRPKNVAKAIEDSFFKIEEDSLMDDEGVWINQLIKARV